MPLVPDLRSGDIDEYLEQYERKGLLRVLTCGSVDDGKSTLIGRLLHDSHLILEDQLDEVRRDSATMGTTGDAIDLALLLDGLKAEREQGITIDVAYRYFSTARRKFIVADTPGHEQYTRNMVTGASTSQLAIILIDAVHGVMAQTKRHGFLASLLGIQHIVVTVNKMDLVDWSRERFEAIREQCHAFTDRLPRPVPLCCLPVSALLGDGVVTAGSSMPWFEGPTLLEHLETVDVTPDAVPSQLRFPVQLVARPDRTFRGYRGTVVSGTVACGDEVVALPSGRTSHVSRIVTFDGEPASAGPGQAVTLTLADDIDVSRGDLIVHPDGLPLSAHDLEADLVWMDQMEMVPGADYLLQQVTSIVPARVTSLHHRLDITTLETEPAQSLVLNAIGRVTISCAQPVLFDAYDDNRTTGAFILIDRLTDATVAAGMIVASSSAWDAVPDAHLTAKISQISSAERQARYGQRPCTLLLTGLTGAGKSTIAIALERRLFDRGRAVVRLDGEDVRLGMSRDLGFSSDDRSENLRRLAEVARLANEAGLIVVAAFTAPNAAVRQRVRELVGEDRFLEIHCEASVEACRRRDPDGLYDAAERGDISNFPGVSAPYDAPESPDLRLDTGAHDVGGCVDRLVELLESRGFINLQPGRGPATS